MGKTLAPFQYNSEGFQNVIGGPRRELKESTKYGTLLLWNNPKGASKDPENPKDNSSKTGMWKAVKQIEFSENAKRGSCSEGRGCELWPARIQQAQLMAQADCQGYLIIIKGYIMDDDGENVFLLIFTPNTKSWSCSGLWDQSINL